MPAGTIDGGLDRLQSSLRDRPEIELPGGIMVRHLLLALLGTCLAFSLAATVQAQPAPTVKVESLPAKTLCGSGCWVMKGGTTTVSRPAALSVAPYGLLTVTE